MPASRAIASSTTSAGCMALKEEIEDAEVELSTMLGRGRITMQQLIDLKPGDILPCDFSGRATVLAEDVPIFRGTFGVSHGQQAVQIEERVIAPQAEDARFTARPQTLIAFTG